MATSSEVSSPSTSSRSQRATYLRRLPPRRLRCVLRLSQPLDALLPSRPAGSISPRSRPWVYPFEALRLPPVPYALSDAASLLRLAKTLDSPTAKAESCPKVTLASGLNTPTRVPGATPVVNLRRRWLPPWGLSPSRLTVISMRSRTTSSPALSLRCPQADHRIGAPES
jgi:hypothetical protein